MLQRFFTHWLDSYRGIPRDIWILSFISLINRCGGLVIAFLALYLTQELHFDIRSAGYATMFFGLGSFVGSYIGGRATDRFGSFPVQFTSLVANGIVLILLLFVRDFWLICAGIFVMALVAEAFRPANSVAIANACTPETRTRSISLYRMAVNLGWAVAPAFGGLMVLFGWPYLFWVDGLTCIAAGFMLLILLPKGYEYRRKELTEEETAIKTSSNSPYQDRTFWYFAILTMLNSMVFMQFLWTVPIYWKESFGWPESRVGMMSALNGLMVFLIEMPLIFRIEGRRPPMQYIRFGLILYTVSYLVFCFPLGHTTAALLFVIAISLGEIFVMPFSSNFVFSRSAGSSQGQYMAIYGIAWSVANTLAPLYGTQVIAAWGYQTLWILLAIQAMVVWVGFWFLEKRKTGVNLAY